MVYAACKESEMKIKHITRKAPAEITPFSLLPPWMQLVHYLLKTDKVLETDAKGELVLQPSQGGREANCREE